MVTPSTKVPRKMLLPTVLATKTPDFALDPALKATSFSGRVVETDRRVRPTVDWARWRRLAIEAVDVERRKPESDRPKVEMRRRRM